MLRIKSRTHPRTASSETVLDAPSSLTPSPLDQSPPAAQPSARPGAIAHDLNNFLTIIRGNCQLLLGDSLVGDSLDAAVRQQILREIQKAGEQATLLTELLHAPAPDAAAPEIRDLAEVVDSVSGMLRSTLGGRHQLIVRLDSSPCPVRLRPGQLERVLINLAANAREAMPRPGVLTVSTAPIEIRPGMPLTGVLAPGSYVLIRVTDTGPGLDDRVKARLFEPQSSTKPGGKGLGLSIIRNILREHAGHIEVHSEAGQGTSFSLYLPLAVSDLSEDSPMPAATPVEPTDTLLLVEDEGMVRAIFRRILQENGYFVLEAANGVEALSLARQFKYPIQLLITDLSMPHMNGMELAHALAALHPEAKVLFLSGYSDGAIPGESPRDPSVAFLQKPFKADTLLQKVREVLAGG